MRIDPRVVRLLLVALILVNLANSGWASRLEGWRAPSDRKVGVRDPHATAVQLSRSAQRTRSQVRHLRDASIFRMADSCRPVLTGCYTIQSADPGAHTLPGQRTAGRSPPLTF